MSARAIARRRAWDVRYVSWTDAPLGLRDDASPCPNPGAGGGTRLVRARLHLLDPGRCSELLSVVVQSDAAARQIDAPFSPPTERLQTQEAGECLVGGRAGPLSFDHEHLICVHRPLGDDALALRQHQPGAGPKQRRSRSGGLALEPHAALEAVPFPQPAPHGPTNSTRHRTGTTRPQAGQPSGRLRQCSCPAASTCTTTDPSHPWQAGHPTGCRASSSASRLTSRLTRSPPPRPAPAPGPPPTSPPPPP